MNKFFKFGFIGVLLLCVGYGVGKYSNPAKVVTKTEVKEVVKIVEIKKEQKDIVVTTKKTIQKDGTVVEESRTEDKSSSSIDTKKDSKAEAVASSKTINDMGLSLHALGLYNFQRTERGIEYGVYVKKRVFGNISVGGLITDQMTFGLSVGMDF